MLNNKTSQVSDGYSQTDTYGWRKYNTSFSLVENYDIILQLLHFSFMWGFTWRDQNEPSTRKILPMVLLFKEQFK